jgi:hypothetical protein
VGSNQTKKEEEEIKTETLATLGYASLSGFVGQLVSSSLWEILALRSLTVIKTKLYQVPFQVGVIKTSGVPKDKILLDPKAEADQTPPTPAK